MAFSLDYKKLLPHVLAIVVFYGVIFAYFTPAFQGYQLKQSDISKFKGMVKEIKDHRETYEDEPLWTNSLFSGMPTFQTSVSYPSNLLRFLDSVFTGFLYRPIGSLFLCFLAFYFLLVSLRVNPYLAIAGALAFGLTTHFVILIEAGHNTKLRAIGYLPALLAGILMILEGKRWLWGLLVCTLFASLEIFAGHIQVTYYFTLFIIVLVIAYGVKALKEKVLPDFARKMGLLVVAAVFGVLTNAAVLYCSYEYSKATMRGGSELTLLPNGQVNENRTEGGLDVDYITMWSLGIDETWSLLVPNAKGGGSKSVEVRPGFPIYSYFGDQPFTSGPTYLGAFVCLLFFLGLILVEGELKWAAAISVLLFIMIAWGKNFLAFTELLINILPMYSKFRAPTIALMGVNLLVPLIGFLGLDRLLKNPELLTTKKTRDALVSVVGGVTVVLLIFTSTPSTLVDLFSQAEISQYDGLVAQGKASDAQVAKMQEEIEDFRTDMVSSSATRTLIIVLIGAGLTFVLVRRKQTIPLAIAVGLLCTVDLWTVDKEYFNNEKSRGKYENWEKKRDYMYAELPDAADLSVMNAESRDNNQLAAQIQMAGEDARKNLDKDTRAFEKYAVANEQFRVLEQNTNFRVFNLGGSFEDSRTSFFHKSIGGYSPVKMGRYQDLIDFYLRSEGNQIITSLRGGGQDIMQVLERLKVLNMLNMKYVKYNPEAAVIPNPYGYGNAWFVQSVVTAENPDEEIQKLGQIDPRNTAVVDQKFAGKLTSQDFASSQGKIDMLSFRSNQMRYQSNSPSGGLAVFSEIYYGQGWNMYIDGAPQPHIRVNYLLRAAEIPAGEHEIEFRFEPKSYAVTNAVGYASSGIVYLLFIGLLAKGFMNSKKPEEENA
ncbi:hypothetical protein KFE98_02235 [bacterium SCSIO 12741]|nr:hypothetical protein KFE98_02235 [bacterium SCSIO 12741]